VLALVATLVSLVGTSSPASAAPSGSTFQPGYIVSDANFFNSNSMTVAQIQSFLDAKGPTNCNGCLKAYRASTYDRAADPKRCTAALTGKTDVSAAQMIYDVSQACHINPMTLLVTLQKETSLVTMSAPESWRYSRAMGYGCPDSAPCSTSYYGLFIQLYSAASQLDYYGSAGSSFTWYPVGTWTAVRYSPNAACGAAAVYIQNRATAALYYYTPYQPNTAALTNLYGTGDSCSAYGNRNFWRTWWDWFGDPTGGIAAPAASHAPSASPSIAPSATATTSTSNPTTSTTTTSTTTTSTTTTSTTTSAAPSPTTPAPPTTVIYTVVPGDTLGQIAARFHTTVAAIAAANALKNVNLIYVGQKLTITATTTTPPPATTTTPPPATTTTPPPATTTTPPPATTTTPPPATGSALVTYTVVAGDTLGTIAAKFHTTVAAIAAANGIANVNFIRVGQKLTVAGFGATATTTTTTVTTPPPPAPAAGTTITYTVVAGDSLSAIAARYHTTVAAIAIANKIKNVNLISIGQKLTITTG
jgi:LysM repeat protein